MSWIKENYHVAALGGGVIVLAGLAYAGFSGNQKVNEEFAEVRGGRGDNVTAKGVELVEKLESSLSGTEAIEKRAVGSGRQVNLFTSVDLFTKAGRSGDLIDLLQVEQPVHGGIDNKWWVENQIDPSPANAPNLDQDGDGFTNGEEFAAKTDPNDPKSHGALITKLEVAEVETDSWLLDFKSVLGSGYQFDLEFLPHGGRTLKNRIPAGKLIQIGELFFPEDPGKERFKMIRVDVREENGPTGLVKVNWAIVEDQRENKKGRLYELPFAPRPNVRLQFIQYDHTFVFRLNAIGEEGTLFKVEENGTFALPSAVEDKGYRVAEVKMDDAHPIRNVTAVVIEYQEDGETKTHTVPVAQAAEPEAGNQGGDGN